MTNLYKFLFVLTALFTAMSAQAADGRFTIEANHPDQISVTMIKGYGGDTVTFTPQGKVFTVEYDNWWDITITPKKGFHVTSITGVDSKGKPVEKENAGWRYNQENFTYTIYSSTSGTILNGYQFKVDSDVYVAPQWNISVDINHPEALSQGTFKVGIETVTAVKGDNRVTINPDQGKFFDAILTPSVETATLTLNGSTITPDTTSDGRLKYKFDLVENAKVVLNATMENPVCWLDCNGVDHIIASYPDTDTSYTLKEGRQELQYTVGSTLRVYAAEGYRLVYSDNMSYDSYTKSYTVTFTGGQSGQTYTIKAEEYVEPVARVVLNLTDPSLVTYVAFSPGYNPHRTFEAGDNLYTYNLEEINSMEIDYKAEKEDDVISACNDQVLTITKDTYGDFISEIALTTPGEYWIAVRERLTGDWAGTPSWAQTDTTLNDAKVNFTLGFNPGGVIEPADASKRIELMRGAEKVCDIGAVMHHGELWMSYGDTELTSGDYTVKVPAGMWKVNGALLGELTYGFKVERPDDGIEDIFDGHNATSHVYSIDGRLAAPAATPEALRSLEPGIYIVAGKKILVK